MVTSICVLVAMATGPLGGQTHLASIRGTILDPSGAAIADAPYRLVSSETNRERAGTSGPDGRFNLAELEPGAYRLEVEVEGYRRSVSQATLAVNQQLQLDIILELGAVTEQVEVVAPSPGLDVGTTGLGTVLDNTLVQSLPLDGRNFLELTLLVPGTAPAAEG